MLNKISNHLDFFQRSLDLRAAKAEVLASNIANADTPGYKAVDFDFGKALALLHKSINGQATPIPRRTQPMRIVCGVPSAVKRFRIAAQI